MQGKRTTISPTAWGLLHFTWQEDELRLSLKNMNNVTGKLWRNGFRQSLIQKTYHLLLLCFFCSFFRIKPASSSFKSRNTDFFLTFSLWHPTKSKGCVPLTLTGSHSYSWSQLLWTATGEVTPIPNAGVKSWWWAPQTSGYWYWVTNIHRSLRSQ